MPKSAVILLAAAIFPGAVAAQDNTWSTRAPLPRTRSQHATVSSGGKLYVFGGNATNPGGQVFAHTMDVYDPVTNAWSTLAGVSPASIYADSTSIGWTDPGGVALDGDIYQFGGTISVVFSFYAYPITIGDGTCLKYSISGNTWSEIASISGSYSEVEATVIGSKIYALQGPTNGVIKEYDPSTNIWTDRAAFPETNLQGFAMGTAGGKVVVAGGFSNTTYLMTDVTREFNPATNLWTTRAPIPTATMWGAGASTGGRMFVLGGFAELETDVYDVVTTVQEYNSATNTWTPRAAMPGGAFWHSAAALAGGSGTKIYSTGGQSDEPYARLAANYEYTPMPLPKPSNPTDLFMRTGSGSDLFEGDWTAGTTVELGARLADPNGLPVQLEVEIVPEASSFTGVPNRVGVEAPPSSTSLTFNGLTEGAWKWRCRCRNGNEEFNPGGWIEFGSAAADINVDLSAPAATVGISPDYEAFVYERNGGAVRFAWAPAVDNSPLPLNYEVEVYGDPELGSLQGTGSVTGATEGDIYLRTGSTARYWRVRAVDFGGHASAWSAVLEFRVLFKDFVDHGAGDALKVCGGSATGSYCPIIFALIAALMGLRRRK